MDFWMLALKYVGGGAVAAFVIYKLYRIWLELPALASLTRIQRFWLFVLFLVLVFLFVMTMLYFAHQESQGENERKQLAELFAVRYASDESLLTRAETNASPAMRPQIHNFSEEYLTLTKQSINSVNSRKQVLSYELQKRIAEMLYSDETKNILPPEILRNLRSNWQSLDRLEHHLPANDTVLKTGTKDVPILTWDDPKFLQHGIPLGSNQLNASANVLGRFAYDPPEGTILKLGTNTLTVIFTPTDTADYSSVTNQVSLVVAEVLPPTKLRVVPVLRWADPGYLLDGTPLGSNQLNATANVPGRFAYDPPEGTILKLGTNTLKVIFTPTDMADYSGVTNKVSIVVVDIMPPSNLRIVPPG
jgi:hypothetical protein